MTQLTVNAKQFKSALKQVSIATDKRKIGSILEGILLHHDGDQLHFIGTDTHRLHITTLPAPAPGNDEHKHHRRAVYD